MVRRVAVDSLESFRLAARALVAAQVAPAEVRFEDPRAPQLALVGGDAPLPASAASPASKTELRVPRELGQLARKVACHRDPRRWDLLYRALHRLLHGEPALLSFATDPDVRALRLLEKAVARDIHKVHAFVRFRPQPDGTLLAWHHPEQRCLQLAAPFFQKRFPNERWSILTPDESAHWDGRELRFGPGAPRSSAPSEDELDALWITYYASMFNPARQNLRAMIREVPLHHWGTLPETRAVLPLLASAGARVTRMRASEGSASSALVPQDRSLPAIAAAARGCTACELCGPATQTVFGEGPAGARLLLVGEQPGDREDLEGRPFVGPAGSVLDDALKAAGLVRDELYLTNAVKHFAFEQRGKVRLHQRPSARNVAACRGWLEAELAVVKPARIVCLGVTAARALFGPRFNLTRNLGRPQPTPHAPWALATYHPAAVLRADDGREIFAQLVRDLGAAAA
ncbi:MAG: UdgX family uracil-DNA binding protein [Myxococcales bacterium]